VCNAAGIALSLEPACTRDAWNVKPESSLHLP
jgi:hypothetical protein